MADDESVPPIAYGRHVGNRLRLYGLTQSDLFSVVRRPDRTEVGPDGKRNALGVINGRTFRAICGADRKMPGGIFVVTFYEEA